MGSVQSFLRVLRHLALPPWWVRRHFPAAVLRDIEQAVAASEARHRGELRLVVEGGLPLDSLWCGQSPRERAIALFAQLRIWDTAENSGVLIYLQLIDRRVEIVADRGIEARVGPEFWSAVCRRMETAFRAGQYRAGALRALEEITEALATHFPAAGGDANNPDNRNNPNELPDRPVLL